jgi:GT2 family glycosyltransferase
MGKIKQPLLKTMTAVSPDTPVGIVIPVYNHVGNENLAATVFTIERCADLPYQISLGIGPNCVAKNRNKGLARLDPDIEFILMADDDILVPPGFLSKMVSTLLQNKAKIGMVSATMMGPRGEPQNDLHPNAIPPGHIEPRILPGTCVLYNRKRTPIEWDENYVGSQWEDTDGWAQVRKMGFQTVANGNVQIMHKNPMSGGGRKYWEQNQGYFFKKWGRNVLEELKP